MVFCEPACCNYDKIISKSKYAYALSPSRSSDTRFNYAFHAQLTSTVINDYVIYDNVLTNESAAYDNTTGIFTCKSSGTYVFSWTTANSNCRASRADLLVNEISIGVTNTHRRHCYSWSENVGSSTGFVAYNLQPGDEVKVKVNGTADTLFSTLSGWQLHQGAPSFYARVSLSDSQSNGSEIRFHNVLNNNKDMYNPETNTFTAQESGLYALTASVEVTDGQAYLSVKRGEVKDEMNFFPGYRERASLPSSVLNSYPLGGFPGTASTLQLVALWRVNARPACMASLETSSSSSPVNFTNERLDMTASLSGSEFRAPKAGVYVIFWNTGLYLNPRHSMLLVNEICVGHAISDRTDGSNVVILRLQKNDSVSLKIDATVYSHKSTVISGYWLF
uniref:Uncharacterized protein LOC111109200 n=1 Tax=Crassostrea virginica TaxID=6565 RepID=A0A8B8BDB5_CRAVI|nr:uncharacterized protein LOC111109200 [Crassostrea virginica]